MLEFMTLLDFIFYIIRTENIIFHPPDHLTVNGLRNNFTTTTAKYQTIINNLIPVYSHTHNRPSFLYSKYHIHLFVSFLVIPEAY